MRYLLLTLVLCCGCSLQGAYVAADKATFEAIVPEYQAYVAADPALDEEQKERRGRTLKAWEARIAEGSE